MSNLAHFSPDQFVADLAARGIELRLESGELGFRARKGALDEETRQRIRNHREALVAVLQRGRARSRLPLSYAQKRLWFLDQLEPGSPEYNIGRVLRVREALDLAVLSASVGDLLARHSSLRSRFFADGGEPAIEVTPAAAVRLEIDDRSGLSCDEIENAIGEACRNAIRTSFDLSAGITSLFRVIRFSPTDHVVLIVVHHIVADGMSIPIVMRDLYEFYSARMQGRAPRLPALPLDYSDVAVNEERRLRGSEAAEEIAFWRRTLDGAPTLLELPTDRPRPLVSTRAGRRHTTYVDAALVRRLDETARKNGATLFMALVSLWQTLLGRLSGQTDVVVGTPVSTRDESGLENVVGCFINNVALRGDVSGQPTYEELLRRTRKTVLEAFSHSAFPFNMVVGAIDPPRSASHAPIFQTLFTFMNFHTDAGSSSPNNGATETLAFDTGRARYDLSLELTYLDGTAGARAGGLEASYEFDTDVFDEQRIARMHEQFVTLLEHAAAHPEAPLAAVPLSTAREIEWTGAQAKAAPPALPTRRPVHEQVAAMAAATPDAVALVTSEETLDFAAFEARANRLAHVLAARGIGAGHRVAVALGRGADLPIALAAVAKTGAAYVPCDPSHPAERIGHVLRDADVSCVITTEEHADQFDAAPRLLIDELSADIAAQSSEPLGRSTQPDDLAYLMYTSGSTGRPKGVAVTHGNLASFLDAMRASPGLQPGEAVLAVTTPTFDISGLELWLPLTTGGRIVMASEDDVVSGEALSDLIAAHDVRMLQATPTTWRLLLDEGWNGKADMKALCGGEAMPVDLASALLQKVGELWNVFGPTETTIWSTTHRVTPNDIAIGRIPVGHPIAGTRTYVMEPAGTLAPQGTPGELWIAGEGVAKGYRNLPDLTASVFIEREILGRTERLYRTGDTARWRADGAIEYLGRSDGQVKVRGFRIELGEIETALAAHPTVRHAYAAVSRDDGNPTLVAYVVYGADAATPTSSELRRFLRDRLPAYMVPALFVAIDAPPLSASGKVDRRRLPDPFRTGERAHRPDESFANETERMLAEIWRELLRTDKVGPADNFFELGGHSLLSLRVAAAVKSRTGFALDPRTLFFQSLRDVAVGIANRTATGPLASG